MRSKDENSFIAFLNLLKVKHTNDFSNRFFNEHPHKYNLFGLSKMLSDYGVENAGTRIADKENDLFHIECPFIAHYGGGFVVIYKVEAPLSPPKGGIPVLIEGEGDDAAKVHYIWNGKKLSLSASQFIQSWSGIILLAETTANSIEPDYKEHRKKELLNFAQKSVLAIACVLILGITFINQSLLSNVRILTLLIVNLIGVYISYLLILQQMHINSQYADKICSLFSKSDCNNVLESDAAKLWGVFGWSEIGLGYFSANILLLLFVPQSISLLALLNIFTLPYAFWSVWYQKAKARQWCPLCLIVQVLLWSLFILNCFFGFIQLPELNVLSILQIIFLSSVFALLIFGLNLLIPNLSKGNEVEKVKQEINSLKANEAVFQTLLKEQAFYDVSKTDSQILFGNPEANLRITILTNPFCNPCAKMHKRAEKLLMKIKGNICIQYFFSSFQPDLDFANKYLIAACLEKDQCEFEHIIADWFEKGKSLKEAFFNDLQLDMENPEIETEFQKHAKWKEKTQLRATPTILINGYKLPDNYKIEDLRYLSPLPEGAGEEKTKNEFNVDFE